MRLDAVDNNEPVSLERFFIKKYRHPVRGSADFNRRGCTDNRCADPLRRDVITIQYFPLAFLGSTPMTAHGRDNKRMSTEPYYFLADYGENGINTGYAPAAGSHCYTVSRLNFCRQRRDADLP